MKIIIIGGGFGGIKTALELDKHRGFEVVLISDRKYFTYYPALYAVATGGSQRQSFIPLDKIFAKTKVQLIYDTIEGYDPQRKLLRGIKNTYYFDRAIFSLGVVTSYFRIKGLRKYSFGIKTAKEVARFRHHIHDEMINQKKDDKQYVIVGGGPTGVELASSLVSHIDHIAKSHSIRNPKISVKLVEAADRVTPRLDPKTSQFITQRLEKVGVEVHVGEKVEWQDDDEVFVSGRSIPTRTVIWTSGVTNHPFFARHSQCFELAKNGRVVVNDHMMTNRHTYVIGDNAYTPYSGLAQTALHDAIYVAKDIVRAKRRQMRPTYQVVQPPVVIPVGKRWAILEWNKLRIAGYLGHLIRRIADLIGYNDMLPIGLAFSTWQAEYSNDETCRRCRTKKRSK